MTKFTPADWLMVVVATVSATFIGMIFTTVAPVLPAIAIDFGGGEYGAFVARWLLTAPSIGVVIGGPVSGWFIERFGTRLVLGVCLFVFALAGISVLFIDSVALLFFCRFLVGLTAVGQLTATVSIVGERYSSEMRGRIVGLQTAFAVAGSVIVVVSSGRLAELGNWRTPSFLYTAAIPVLCACLVLFKPVQHGERLGLAGNSKGLVKLVPTFVMVAVTMMVSFIPLNQTPLLLTADGITSPSTIAMVMGSASVAMAFGAFSYGRVRRRFGTRGTLSIALSILSIGLAELSFLHGIAGMVAANVVLGLGGGFLTPLFGHHILDTAPPAIRGKAVGFMFAAQFVGPILYSALIAPVAIVVGPRIAIVSIAAALAVWVLGLFRGAFGRNISPHSV